MIKVVLKTGQIIKQNNIQEVVNELRRSCRTPSSSRVEYKKELARRFRVYYGKHLNFISDEKFLYGLLKAGEIKLIENEDQNYEEEIFG